MLIDKQKYFEKIVNKENFTMKNNLNQTLQD